MPIRIAENFRAIFYAPFYAAKALGFYAREGIDVELLNSSTAGDGVVALLDGTVDLTWGGPMRVIKARDQNPDSQLACFCEVVARDPFFLVGKSDRPDFHLADLTGLKLATVSEVPTPWLCLQHDLRLHGVDASRLPRTADGTMAQNYAALCAGQIDVAQLFEPYASLALRSGAGRILHAASARGATSYTAFIATRSGIDRHRTAFEGIARGIGHMQRWLAEHGAEDLADVTAPFFPDVASDVLVRSLERYREAGIWACTADISRAGFARLAESLLSGGFISRLPDYDECVAHPFAQ